MSCRIAATRNRPTQPAIGLVQSFGNLLKLVGLFVFGDAAMLEPVISAVRVAKDMTIRWVAGLRGFVLGIPSVVIDATLVIALTGVLAISLLCAVMGSL